LKRMITSCWNITRVSRDGLFYSYILLTVFLIVDVTQTLTTSLTSLSKTHKRPALSSIFLLNNISFIRSKLILEPEAAIDEFVSSPELQTHLNTQYRTAKASYYEANFTALLSALGDERHKGKQGMKEKFATFFDALEEVAERHRFARVLGDDEDGRAGLADDVVKLVIPALQRFMQKTKDKEFSKSKFISTLPFNKLNAPAIPRPTKM
jgi:exocyst complex component 7